MDLRRLEILLELSRLGSMREVAAEMHITTSTVSQQIAVLAREVGTPLVEPEGRRVRLTPAGRRLAEHAVTILAAAEAARADLDPGAEPSGTLRVAGFATAVRRSLLPVAAELAVHHPDVRLRIHEHEPFECADLLASDAIDLALTYEYNLAPAPLDPTLEAVPLWTTAWGLGVSADAPMIPRESSPKVFARFRDQPWIANSRNDADERALRVLGAMAGFEPRIEHYADSLELVQDLIVAGFGVGLLPAGEPTSPGVHVVPLRDPGVELRSFAVVRRGRAGWPPLALVLRMVAAAATA